MNSNHLKIKPSSISTKAFLIKPLSLAAFCLSTVLFSACQPNSNNADKNPETEMTSENHDNSMDHDSHNASQEMTDHEMTDHKKTSGFGKEYMDSMNNMHEDMMKGTTANNADVAFAKEMLSHHKGAVEMAKIQLKYGKDETMRKLAEDIIAAQENEINQMNNWLASNPDTEEQVYTKEMQKAYNDSMMPMHADMMQGIQSEDADMAFAKSMLPHHKGAVAMAKVQLKYGKDKEMRQLAQNIIYAQQSEIELMQNWIQQHS
ncbi:DUF305 domain-containing protein [Psychrobacter sp.]|uniref:CopM family metallochaperone n=1 Tax=Psychrobacter sp. TaxID=56811 RepID=UPI0025F378D6|nr:DUF305 domain-containing protein [Psychrobacter sp.]